MTDISQKTTQCLFLVAVLVSGLTIFLFSRNPAR